MAESSAAGSARATAFDSAEMGAIAHLYRGEVCRWCWSSSWSPSS